MTDPTVAADVRSTTAHRRWPASKRKMSFGLMVPLSEGSHGGGTEAPDFDRILEIVRTADAAGIEIVWFQDHFSNPANDAFDRERGCWEAFTLMAGLAGATRDLDIAYGPLVACAGFRHPGLLARMTETIDEISNGKFVIGIGAGWHEPEYDAYDFPFDHRVSRFEDAIAIVAEMLRDGKSTHDGRYFSTDGALNLPRGPRGDTGGAPILVGSTGDRMLGLIARYADAWNTGWIHEISDLTPRLEKVNAALDAAGRDRDTLVLTVGGNVGLDGATGRRGDMLTGTDEEIAQRFIAFRDAGIDHFVVGLDPGTPEAVEHLGRIIAQVDQS